LATRITGVAVTFDRPMNPATVTRADFKVYDPFGRRVAVRSVAPLDPSNTRFHVQTKLWRCAGVYTVESGPNVADVYGNGMDGNGNGAFLDVDDRTVTTHAIANDVSWARRGPKIPRGKSVTVALAFRPDVAIDQLAIELNLQHPSVGDLRVTLIAPDGKEILLVDHRGGAAADFTNTIFSTEATTPIAGASAPFTGDFAPEDAAGLSGLRGVNARGKWRLRIEDTGAGEVGRLLSWGLYVKPLT
jgi:subtilisin-like proprotein convertase family protein